MSAAVVEKDVRGGIGAAPRSREEEKNPLPQRRSASRPEASHAAQDTAGTDPSDNRTREADGSFQKKFRRSEIFFSGW